MMPGFPPPIAGRWTLATWQLPPYNRTTFHSLREAVPTARVSRGAAAHPRGGHDLAQGVEGRPVIRRKLPRSQRPPPGDRRRETGHHLPSRSAADEHQRREVSEDAAGARRRLIGTADDARFPA